MAFLELTHVSKSFGGNGVLSDVNLSIERGEFALIVGYSGSGKTTLISLIAGLLAPDAGTIKLNGLEISEPGPDRGVVFQNYSLLPWLSVFENIALAVEQVFPNYSPEKKRQHVERAIAMVNLTPARDKLPRQLSGGMRQRVSVARAIAMDPQIVLLAEPLSALDALTRSTLQGEIERIGADRKQLLEDPEYYRLREQLIGFLEERSHLQTARPTVDGPASPPAPPPRLQRLLRALTPA